MEEPAACVCAYAAKKEARLRVTTDSGEQSPVARTCSRGSRCGGCALELTVLPYGQQDTAVVLVGQCFGVFGVGTLSWSSELKVELVDAKRYAFGYVEFHSVVSSNELPFPGLQCDGLRLAACAGTARVSTAELLQE